MHSFRWTMVENPYAQKPFIHRPAISLNLSLLDENALKNLYTLTSKHNGRIMITVQGTRCIGDQNYNGRWNASIVISPVENSALIILQSVWKGYPVLGMEGSFLIDEPIEIDKHLANFHWNDERDNGRYVSLH